MTSFYSGLIIRWTHVGTWLVIFHILKDEFKILKLISNKFYRPNIDNIDNNY